MEEEIEKAFYDISSFKQDIPTYIYCHILLIFKDLETFKKNEIKNWYDAAREYVYFMSRNNVDIVKGASVSFCFDNEIEKEAKRIYRPGLFIIKVKLY